MIDKMAPPLVTVVMPVYNAGRQLAAAVRSIQQQSFRNWELLLLDDGSTDGAVESLSCLDDDRIRIFSDCLRKGIAVRLNQGIAQARGVFVARMDADDVAFPERLAKQLTRLDADPRLDLLGVSFVTINEDNQIVGALASPLRHEEICARPWLGFHLAHPGWMGRTAWFRMHLYRVPAPYACEDQELLLRTYQCSRFACLPETLLGYRIREEMDRSKLLRTRRAMLGFQMQKFFAERLWVDLALSIACYCSRVVRDMWLILRKKNLWPNDTSLISPALMAEWHEVRNRIIF